MEIFAVHIRNLTDGQALAPVEHFALYARDTVSYVVGMIAHGGVEMGEEDFDENISGYLRMSRNHFLALEKPPKPVEWGNYFIADGNDELFPNDNINFLAPCSAVDVFMVAGVGGEMEHDERY